MDVPGIVRKVLDVSGLKQSGLAAKIKVSQGTISKWMNEGHSPNLDQWGRLVQFANRFPALRDIVKGASFSVGVQIEGYIGAGAEIQPEHEQVPPEGLEQVDLPFAVSTDMIAFRVKGDSMLPAYRDGDVVLVWREQRGDPEQHYGDDMAVLTAHGQRFIKEIQPGSRKGLFNLSSHNAKLIKDVRLEWIGEIHSTIKNSQVRKTGDTPARKRRAATG